jgi:enolase
VERALAAVEKEIAPALLGGDAADQEGLDQALIELDGTAEKSRLGANAILGVSLAAARAAATQRGEPLWRYLAGLAAAEPSLPVPFMNVVNGGVHADDNLDFQEFMLVPVGFESFAQALAAGVEVYSRLREHLGELNLSVALGDEGGFTPSLASSDAVLELLEKAIEAAGLRPGIDVALAIEPAASELWRDGVYRLLGECHELSSEQMVDRLAWLADCHPIVAIEDGIAEGDVAGWRRLTERLGERVQLIGDDVFVTNPSILREGIENGVANSVLVKPNQIGTLSETLETIALAHEAGYRTMISHRSGETEDTFIADLAVGTGAGQIKCGAPARSERVAKYNRLLRIEEELGEAARFAWPARC